MKATGLVLMLAATACVNAFAQPSAIDAARGGDAKLLTSLVASQADINAADADGTTALHWSAYRGDVAAVDALLAAGAKPDARTRLGATPLYLAAERGDASLIRRLLKAGVDANGTVLLKGETPLMFAARSGSVESVQALLDAGANIEAKETYRETNALHWAATQNQAGVVRLLLARGADPAVMSRVEVKKAARSAGDRSQTPLPDVRSKGMTALVLAARENALDTVKVLLDGGASINQQSGDGSTPLLVAVQNAHTELASYLMQRGADVNLANANGWSPLYLAVKMRTMEVGSMPNPRTSPAILYATIEELIAHGADVNAKVKGQTLVRDFFQAIWLKEAGGTALIRAGLGGDLEVIKLLLSKGANPLARTDDGSTVLMALAGVGFSPGYIQDIAGPAQTLEAMQMMLDAGVDIRASNSNGVQAIHGAAHKNFVKGIEFLVARGADLSAISQHHPNHVTAFAEFKGNTVLDWAYGVQTGGCSSVYNAEAVDSVESMLKARRMPLKRLMITAGGAVGQASEDAALASPCN